VFRALLVIVGGTVLTLYTLSAVAGQRPTATADEVWSHSGARNHPFVIGKASPHSFLTQRQAAQSPNIRKLPH
jgi:hypothetical protein